MEEEVNTQEVDYSPETNAKFIQMMGDLTAAFRAAGRPLFMTARTRAGENWECWATCTSVVPGEFDIVRLRRVWRKFHMTYFDAAPSHLRWRKVQKRKQLEGAKKT